jgi:hypothetical protein
MVAHFLDDVRALVAAALADVADRVVVGTLEDGERIVAAMLRNAAVGFAADRVAGARLRQLGAVAGVQAAAALDLLDTTAAGRPVVFDRAGAKGLGDQLQAAAKASGCYYLGFTKQCATDADLANPRPAGTQGETKVKVVANLNVRAEARDDAGVVGVVPQSSCVAVDNCLTASDGVWCSAKFGDKQAWLHKLALRRNKWAIVTFTNKCD